MRRPPPTVLTAILLSAAAVACTAAPRPCPEPEVPPLAQPQQPSPAPVARLAPKPVAPAGPVRDDRPKELGRVTVAAVGDVLPHVSVKLSAAAANAKDGQGTSTNNDGYDALYADVAGDLAAADFSVANLETPVSPSGDPGNVEYHFNAPPVLLASLKASGFKLVSFANNHVMDQARRGFDETLAELDKAGLPYYGAGKNQQESAKGLRLEKNGVKVAFLGATDFVNQSQHLSADPKLSHVNKLDEAVAMAEAVKAAREDSDFVIVSLHWGVEYQPKPRESEVKLAHELFEAGADVILGTHPHILQPLEVYEAADGRTCLVIYSLGNFVSNQSYHYKFGISPDKVGDTRDSAVLKFAIAKRDYGNGGVRAEIADVSYLPIWTINERATQGEGKEKKETVYIRTVAMERGLGAARAELDAFVAKLPEKPSKEQQAGIVKLKKKVELYEKRRGIVEARLGEGFAAEHQP
ncbi:MAG TPA: CapA family protein [Myxococcales bacterium]|jgi:poly-gamma-glutamate synthesis protein (capsule biosynthesis protein)